MALTVAVPLELPVDGRQSETASAVARGTARLLHAYGRCVVSELPLPSGRRADLVALDPGGEIWIVEIKSSVADFRADQKWMDYRLHCDRLFFATTVEVPCEIFPPDTGLIVADANQEHGIVAHRSGDPAKLPELPVGTLLRILPNHACATGAQHERYRVLGEAGRVANDADLVPHHVV